MSEIEAGEWVRLKDGRIRKFLQYVEDDDVPNAWVELTRPYNMVQITDIVKRSKNIIDLIEVGDYVNGVEVIDIVIEYRNNEAEKSLYMDSDMGTGYQNQMFSEHIKSIVTKEQFEQLKYTVKED